MQGFLTPTEPGVITLGYGMGTSPAPKKPKVKPVVNIGGGGDDPWRIPTIDDVVFPYRKGPPILVTEMMPAVSAINQYRPDVVPDMNIDWDRAGIMSDMIDELRKDNADKTRHIDLLNRMLGWYLNNRPGGMNIMPVLPVLPNIPIPGLPLHELPASIPTSAHEKKFPDVGRAIGLIIGWFMSLKLWQKIIVALVVMGILLFVLWKWMRRK